MIRVIHQCCISKPQVQSPKALQRPSWARSVHSALKLGMRLFRDAQLDGLLCSCCMLTLPLGGGKYGGNILRLVIPILTQMLDWGVRVAGCWRRKRRQRGQSSSSAWPVFASRITCRAEMEGRSCTHVIQLTLESVCMERNKYQPHLCVCNS